MARTVKSTPAVIAGRKHKARQFADAADVVLALTNEAADVADAYVTLLVHAGIAAADVICCVRLGEHSQSNDHNDAKALLAKAEKPLVKDLKTLLDAKTKAGYAATHISTEERLRCERACERLMRVMAAL